jgi:4-hydroxy-tetrahydrodipicolinate synthase
VPAIDWRGVYPALTTQFLSDESLDLAGTARHLEHLIAEGIHGVIVLGTVGENTTLEYAEKLDVLRMAVDTAKGRIPVLTGVAECSTRLARRFAADAENLGINGLMLLPGMVYKSDPRETIAHFRAVAHASGLPIMCYNNPVSYGVDITPAMFAELADEPTLVAIKESSDNPRRITDLVNELGDRYVIFSGVDDLVMECAMLGAVGWVSGLVNAFPRENRVLWELLEAGSYPEALALYRWCTPLLHLDTKPKLVQYIKLCMAEVGLGSEMVRTPKLPIAGAERDEILAIIRKALATRPQLA